MFFDANKNYSHIKQIPFYPNDQDEYNNECKNPSNYTTDNGSYITTCLFWICTLKDEMQIKYKSLNQTLKKYFQYKICVV